MIVIDSYNFYCDTNHLLQPKPLDYEGMINRLISIDCSLFYNIISSPSCRYETSFSTGRIKEHYASMNAEERFINIFNEKIMYANPKGYFVNKLKGEPKNCEQIKSVSFTFRDYDNLSKHFVARGSEFGICFYHDFLQQKGLRPVQYIHESNDEKLRHLMFNTPHLIEVNAAGYDMSWENEWRLNQDLYFTTEDIAFVIVPPDRHRYFVEWFMDNDDFVDTKVVSSNLYKSYVDHLIFYPQQTDNNWNQVEIFRNQWGKGIKVSPDDFNYLSRKERNLFSNKYKDELECFSKNTLLLNYEPKLLNKFLDFKIKLNNTAMLDSIFTSHRVMGLNGIEPDDAERDMIIRLFEALFEEFPPAL